MYRLICNGSDILYKSGNMAWSSDTDTLGLQITFDSLLDLNEGSIISFFKGTKELFRGSIIRKSEQKFTFSYTAIDYSRHLKNEVIKQFNKVKASTAISSLLGEYGVKSDIVNIPTVIDHIYKDSIENIVNDVLEKAENDQGVKYFKEINIDTVVIRKLSDMRITPKILVNGDFTIDSSIENMKNRIVVVNSEESSMATYATTQDTNSIKRYGLMQKLEKIDEKNIAQAKNIANNLLSECNKVFKSTSLNLLGIKDAETIKANRLIYIDVAGKLKGWYKIKSANHTLTNTTHKVSIELEW